MIGLINIVIEGLIVLLRGLIRLYQLCLSPYLGKSCRFQPTCSNYAMSSLKTQGLLKGLYLTVRRILCCHPWHPGGLDPVPQEFHWVPKENRLETSQRLKH